MDEMRAMLDDLMGKERNLSREERDKVKPKQKKFSDRDVCKYYLCGFCPYSEFEKTKNDLGRCPDVHDDDCVADWNKLSASEKDRYGYERDLLRKTERLLGDLHKRMDSNKQRLKMLEKPVVLAEDQVALDVMSKQIDDLLAQAAKMGEAGDIDGAEAVTRQAENIKKQRVLLEKDAAARGHPTRNLIQQVCPVSGLIINNEETRMRDHHAGRNYNSWKKLHEIHDELKETLSQREKERRESRKDRDRHRSRSRDRNRDRRRSRSRSRDRYRRDDGSRRDRDRDYRRGDKDRDDRRRRERSRSRSRERTRDRTKSPVVAEPVVTTEAERSPGEIVE